MSGIYPHNSDHCHCLECEKVRRQVRNIAQEEISDHVRAEQIIAAVDKDTEARADRIRRNAAWAARHETRLASGGFVGGSGGLSTDNIERRIFGGGLINPNGKIWEMLHRRNPKTFGPTLPDLWRATVDEEFLFESDPRYKDACARRYSSYQHRCDWRWLKGQSGSWRRWDFTHRCYFGKLYDHVTITTGGYRAYLSGVGIAMISAIEHTEHERVGQIEKTVTDRVEFTLPYPDVFGNCHTATVDNGTIIKWIGHGGQHEMATRTRTTVERIHDETITTVEELPAAGRWIKTNPPRTWSETNSDSLKFMAPDWARMQHITPEEAKETTVSLSNLKLSILLWLNAGYPSTHPEHGTSRGSAAIRELTMSGLIVADPGHYNSYRTTKKAHVLLEALVAMPLPVAAEPKWEMPKA